MDFTIPEVLPLWIAGTPVTSSDRFTNNNPYTNESLCQVSIASSEEIEQAVAKAVDAQKKWAQFSAKQRAEVLIKTSQLLRKHNDELAKIESLDSGRVINETQAVDIISGADCLDYFAALIQTHSTRFVELPNDTFAYTLQQPLGVCLGIGAWNYPLQIACWKAAPALASGNAVIFKPSEMTPISAYFLGLIFKEAGLPDGLFSVLQGDGLVGANLVNHPQIRKVSLTGSIPTGKKIYEACAKNMKKISFELGGKSPLIIFSDCDLKSAVHAAMAANFYSQGEICSNGTRMFVHESIKQDFEQEFVRLSKQLRMGNPLDPTSQVGPLINSQQKEKVLNYIELAKQQGAKEILGWSDFKNHPENQSEGQTDRSFGLTNENDNFLPPVILTDCEDHMTHCQEEIFGPVASLLSFKSEDEVIQRANNTEFGLAGGVFTKDIQRAHRVAKQLEVGICWINNYNITPIEVPFGGAKQSGIGSENGHEALKEYTRTQTVYVEGGEVDFPF